MTRDFYGVQPAKIRTLISAAASQSPLTAAGGASAVTATGLPRCLIDEAVVGRVSALVERGVLDAQSDLSKTRYSEVLLVTT